MYDPQSGKLWNNNHCSICDIWHQNRVVQHWDFLQKNWLNSAEVRKTKVWIFSTRSSTQSEGLGRNNRKTPGKTFCCHYLQCNLTDSYQHIVPFSFCCLGRKYLQSFEIQAFPSIHDLAYKYIHTIKQSLVSTVSR